MSNAPCKNCPNKGCGSYHSQCEKYIAFQKECEEARKQRKNEADYLSYKRRLYQNKKKEEIK